MSFWIDLLFQINGIPFFFFLPHISSSILFTSSALVLKSSSRFAMFEITIFELGCFTDSAISNLFSYFIASFIQGNVVSVNMYDK